MPQFCEYRSGYLVPIVNNCYIKYLTRSLRRNKSDFVTERGREGQRKGQHRKARELQNKIIFIVWAPHGVRAKNIAESLGAHVEFIHWKFKQKIYSPVKYPILFLKTVRILFKERPSIIICQSPPMFCAGAAIVYKTLVRKKDIKIIIDAHSASFVKPWSHFRCLDKRLMKRAIVTLVSNRELSELVSANYDIRPVILEDRIPNFSQSRTRTNEFNKRSPENKNTFRITIVASFAPDEPIDEILDASRQMPEIEFYITGPNNMTRLPTGRIPSNVTLTGMKDTSSYVSLLKEMDCLMVLTKRDKTLLAGAMEAMALEKPLITSKWPPLLRYYNTGTVHVDNSPEEITAAIKKVREHKNELTRQMSALKIQRMAEWEQKLTEFSEILNGGHLVDE